MLEHEVPAQAPDDPDRLPHPAEPMAVKLRKLEDLLRRGAISPAEYARHRAEADDEL